jgi:1,4-dihydroxy-2-naphthoate octaprenyltransferase
MTFVSTCLAGILAYASGGFSIPVFLLTMIGLIIAHISANMTNDWYDVKHGIDENAPTSQYRPHPLLHGELDKSTYKMVIIGMYSIGLIIALYLTWLRGIPVLIFTILGVLFGVFYTADPILLKHRSVGEISTFLAFGPLMVGGAYYALTGKLDLEPMIASTPIGFLVALVLLSNNLRDKDYDASVGIKTLTTKQDIKTGLIYFKILMASAYIATIILIIQRILSPFSFITFLTLKEAQNIITDFNTEIPLNSDQITAQLALHYGVLLTLGELLNIIYITNF